MILYFLAKTASTVATNHRVSHGTVCIFCAHRIENRGALRDREQCCYCAAQPPEAMQSLTHISALLLQFLQARPKRLQKTSSMSSTWAASSQQGEGHLRGAILPTCLHALWGAYLLRLRGRGSLELAHTSRLGPGTSTVGFRSALMAESIKHLMKHYHNSPGKS